METRKHIFTLEVDEALATRLDEAMVFCRINGLKNSDGLLLRAMLGRVVTCPHLLDAIQERKELESEQRRSTAGAHAKQGISLWIDADIVQKTAAVIDTAKRTGRTCSKGAVARAMLDCLQQGPELLGLVRARMDLEKQQRRAKASPRRDGRSRRKRSGRTT